MSSFFVTVMILQVVVIGVVGGSGLNIGVQNGIRRQLKARGPVYLFYLFIRLYSTHACTIIQYLCICKYLQEASVLKVCGLTPTA